MVWAETTLEKRIDWRSYGIDARVILPPSRDILRTCKYPNGGLGITRTTIVAPLTYDTTDSSVTTVTQMAQIRHYCQLLQVPFEIGKFGLEKGQEMAFKTRMHMPINKVL